MTPKSNFQSFAVIPAAGDSVRMGRPKLLMPWRDATLIEHVLSVWSSSRVHHTVVVVRPTDQRLHELCLAAGAEVVLPREPPAEMKVSVQIGLRHVQRKYRPQGEDVCLWAPADIPHLSVPLIDQLLAAHDASAPRILVPQTPAGRGHPLLVPWSVAEQALSLRPGETLKSLVERNPARAIAWSDPSILEDLDTPSDYERLASGDSLGE
jgi:molybdenum cofactor cytidylyltransferase